MKRLDWFVGMHWFWWFTTLENDAGLGQGHARPKVYCLCSVLYRADVFILTPLVHSIIHSFTLFSMSNAIHSWCSRVIAAASLISPIISIRQHIRYYTYSTITLFRREMVVIAFESRISERKLAFSFYTPKNPQRWYL